MEKKQTAVEWLIEQVHSDQYQNAFGQTYISIELVEQAKQMEKEQSASREALHAAFKAGWMKANATNYNESYFNHYYDNL